MESHPSPSHLYPYHSEVVLFGNSGGYDETGRSLSDLVSDPTGSCTENFTIPSKYLHASPYISMVSSIASLFGSFLIILTFIIWKDIRTMARAILVFLAMADFVTAAGYLFGSAVYLRYQVLHKGALNGSEEENYDWLCRVQSYVTTVAPISSFLWTTHLAIYLLITIVLQKKQLARKMFIFFHITAWGIPLLVCTPALFTKNLGPGTSRTSTSWCFVAFENTYSGHQRDYDRKLARLYGFELLCGKFWEILACIVAAILYITVKVSLWRRKQQLRIASNDGYGSLTINRRFTVAVVNLDQKLIWIPVVFIFLRMWGTIRFFISFSPSCHHPYKDCSPPTIVIEEHCARYLYDPALIIMQSVGDPAQGWGNAILFVFFTRTIAKRLCPCCFILGEKLNSCFSAIAEALKGSCSRSISTDLSEDHQKTSSFCSTDSGVDPPLVSPPITGPISGDTPPERRRDRHTQ